jgi:hypothetical protein
MIPTAFIGLLALSSVTVNAQKLPQWTTSNAWSSYDRTDGFAPVGALNTVGHDTFTTFSHPLFPEYSARIKQSDWCDSTVKRVLLVEPSVCKLY